MLGPNFNTSQSGFMPSYNGEILNYIITVTTTATRLGTLLVTAGSTYINGIPLIIDEMSTGPGSQQTRLRPTWHLFLQTLSTSTNSVFVTWDNSTTPLTTGLGRECMPGVIQPFYNAGVALLRQKAIGLYQVPATSAFQLIAAGSTKMLVTFSD